MNTAMPNAPHLPPTPLQPPPEAAPDLPACDVTRRYVKVQEVRTDGLVAFEFAIGWPELSVELLLPLAAFNEFCARNQVVRLDS